MGKTLTWIFIIIVIVWNWTGSVTFTYFWVGFVVLVFAFLLFFHLTSERDAKKLAKEMKEKRE